MELSIRVQFPTIAPILYNERVIEKLVLATRIMANALPVVGMVLLVPLVENDYVLTAIYIAVIITALVIKNDKKDRVFLIFGFFASFIAETLFISTGIETFNRTSLVGIMPMWLPVLWAYIFMAMRRAIEALNSYLRPLGP